MGLVFKFLWLVELRHWENQGANRSRVCSEHCSISPRAALCSLLVRPGNLRRLQTTVFFLPIFFSEFQCYVRTSVLSLLTSLPTLLRRQLRRELSRKSSKLGKTFDWSSRFLFSKPIHRPRIGHSCVRWGMYKNHICRNIQQGPFKFLHQKRFSLGKNFVVSNEFCCRNISFETIFFAQEIYIYILLKNLNGPCCRSQMKNIQF